MTSKSRSALPLFGVRVIDFGQYIAGPAVAMILGDLGATVVHIDPPSGPFWDNPANAILNRNKLTVVIDLKTEAGLQEARSLVAEADIVIENFRPGVLARLGIDVKALREGRPELISVSIPGFASNDQLRRDWRAFETVIAASSGVFTDMGLNRVLMGINPSFSPLPLASAYGTMLAASAALLALQSRERTGNGDHIEVPLAAAVMEGLSYNSIKIDDYPLRYQTQREQEIERRRSQGLPMDMSYDDLQEFLDPFYRSFECSDGRMFYVVCPSHKNHARRCLQTLGLYDELLAEGLREEEDTYLPVSEWSSDVSLGVYPLPKFWADKVAGRMKAVFLTKTAAEWEYVFGEGLFPGAPQRWLKEWLADEHAKTAGLMIEVDDPAFGRMTQPGPIVWLNESAQAMLTPAPRAWGSVAEALARLRSTKAPQLPAPTLDTPSGWLDGIKVLDLCNVIAGPHSVAYLARFGAEVIKIDPAKPFYDCWNTVIFGMSHMRGKKSALLNVSSPDGRLAFERLVKSVDVIVWNATDRQVNAMGLDLDGLKALNPQAIFCQLDCFGGVCTGPRTNYLGYDDLVQAATGIMLRFGGSMQTPEEHAHVGTIDVMCGFGAAVGIASALYQKSTTGVVGRPRTSLSALSGLAQIPFCYDYDGRPPFDEPAGRETKGFNALSRIYETLDEGSIVLAASEADLSRFANVTGLNDLPSIPLSDREAYLTKAFATASAESWQKRLIDADIGAALCENLESIRSRSARVADGTPGTDRGSYSFSIFPDHPSGHVVTQLDPFAVRPSLARVNSLLPAEKYGASTIHVLTEHGCDAEEIESMIVSGTASISWSRKYLPS
ncbi:CoA transferase [Pararhizobium antarcticum]|uniref:Carnitine dehydratase n=1 Tax=Pararhizobium antarcticum TaxID=1798805 RepID=A0A657LLY9_9HYPH|nr:CoA transferase [Pararhizobium antarcticum]OJF91771.1 carnitine dehydratase [Pararhizobium antarcticum]OJF96159.1 carnitine dehydratase [Rhizobium sp. 58]